MDPQIYKEMIEQEDTHWWFRARRSIISSLLQTIQLPEHAKILDAGCGSGGNLSVLAGRGELYAFEMNDRAREHAITRGSARIEVGRLPDAIPFPDVNFDLIGFFDVLEHVEDDAAALRALTARLKPGGVLCINVPAYQWLFVRHDRLHHHFRRYSRRELVRKIEAAGLKVEFVSYWNFLLFPVAMLVRLIDCFGYPKEHTLGSQKPTRFINSLLFSLVSAERHILPRMRLPFGLSLIMLARKPH